MNRRDLIGAAALQPQRRGAGVAELRRDAPAAGSYLINGRAPKVGETVRLPLLAKTLREIAAKGAAGFYEGWVAEDMARSRQALGGLHTVEEARDTIPHCDKGRGGRGPLQEVATIEGDGVLVERGRVGARGVHGRWRRAWW